MTIETMILSASGNLWLIHIMIHHMIHKRFSSQRVLQSLRQLLSARDQNLEAAACSCRPAAGQVWGCAVLLEAFDQMDQARVAGIFDCLSH